MTFNKLLLCGGAGYIGSEITRFFLEKNFKVSSVDNLLYDNYFSVKKFIENKKFKFYNLNISSKEINKEFIDGFDTVVLLSGLVGDPITKKYNDLSIIYNEIYLKKIIDICTKSKIKKLIFISTCSNYGLVKENQTAHEDFLLNPLSQYAKSKIKIEKYLKENCNNSNIQTTILRFATAFGLSSRMRFDLTISHFFKDAFLNRKLKVFDKDTWRPYCHVRDFSRLISKVIEDRGTYDFCVFNAGGDKNNHTKEQIVNKILSKLPNIQVDYNSNDVDPRNYKVDFSRVYNKFNFVPKYDLDYGIDELNESFKKNIFNFNSKNINKFGNYSLDHLL